MSHGFLTRYANNSFPPEYRAALFVDGEHRLTWTSLFFEQFPDADIYLVGGTLRDVLLGRTPDDIDIVIRNVAIETLSSWLQAHGAFEIAGKRFGTFKFSPHGCAGQSPIDIALPRKEMIGEEHFSGRSDLSVQFDPKLPIQDDLSRRDFTVNAIAYDLRRHKFIDPYGGMEDLHDGIIRAVENPTERFFEDATRMLRGLRFASQLRFGIEEHTWRAIQEFIVLLNNTRMLEDGTHAYVIPREMIGKEFILGFAAHPTHTLNLWRSSGALKQFMPSIDTLQDVIEEDGKNAFERTIETLHMLEKPAFLRTYKRQKPSATLLVAGLFSHLQEDLSRNGFDVCKKLYFHQFPKRHRGFVDCSSVLWMLERLHTFEDQDPASMAPSDFERQFCNERGAELLMLMHAVQIVSGRHSVARERLHTARRILEHMMTTICPDGTERLSELLSGHDLKQLGIPEGPAYRNIKNHIRDAQLTHRIHTKEEAIALAREWIRRS